MNRFLVASLSLAGALASLPAAAQFQKPEDAIKYRQSAMALQGNHLGRVFAVVNGRVPFDPKATADNIEIVALINRLQFAGFVEGSDKGGNTRAKPEIWTEKDKWNAAVAKSQEDVNKLAAAGKSGNLDQIKVAAGAVGQSCKGCHDTYRKD
ncbi:MAG: cytochrome c [Burkholderiaceae bacterium]|nr:cytochrome c [Burkholderiaceae bacterium]